MASGHTVPCSCLLRERDGGGGGGGGGGGERDLGRDSARMLVFSAASSAPRPFDLKRAEEGRGGLVLI